MRRFKWNPFSNMSFRAKLIISNAILASAILIMMAFYLISRATATSDFMAEKLTQAVQDVTENELTGNATRFAGELDHFFGSLLGHIETITSALKIEMANEHAYEPVSASSLRRLPQGSWGNSESEPGSFFISNQDVIPEAILSEIGIIRQIDLIVPSIMETDPDVLAIYFGSVLGEMLYYPNIDLAADLPHDFDVTEQPWFVDAVPQANPTSKTICSDPYQNASQIPIITCSAPVYDVSNQFRGVIAIDIKLAHVTDLISVIPVGKTGYAFVIDTEGHVLAMPQRGYGDFGLSNNVGQDLLKESVVKTAPLELFGAIGWMTNGLRGFRSATVDSVDKYIAFSPIPTMGYSIGLVVPVSEMQGPVLATQARLNLDKRETLIKLVTGSVVVLLIFLAAVLWLGTALTSPITRLTKTASLIAEGDIQRVAEVGSNDEIGLLASTLNLMTKNLRELINNLEHRVEERTQELQISNTTLEQRAQELAAINSVQAAFVSKLEMQAIYEAVGDKLRGIFHQADVGIRIYDPKTDMLYFPFAYENGERINIDPLKMNDKGVVAHIFRTHEPLLINENLEHEAEKYGAFTIPGTQQEKSLLMVPLMIGDQVHGILELVDMQHEHAFNESDMRLLQTLANSMSVALENARLFEETQHLLKETEQRNAELAIINSVQSALAAKLDMQSIYDAVGDKIREIFDAQVVDIGVYDRKENLVHFPYTIERGVRFPDEPIELIGYRRHVIKTRQYLLINEDIDEANAKYGNPTAISGEPAKSILFVPMIVGNDIRGVISLQNLDHENAFSESDVSLLTTLANSMSVALENARLFDETQRLLKQTEQRAAELAAISMVSQALVAETDLDSMIQLIGSQMREIFDADIVYIALLDPETKLIQFPYQIGESFTTLKLGEGLTGKIIDTGEPLLFNTDVNARSLEIGATPVGTEVLSYLGVPIMVGGKPIGVISVQSTTQEGLFDDDSLRLLTTIASNTGAAIHTARLYTETQRLLKQTEQRATELQIINNIGQTLTEGLDLDSTIERVGERLREALKIESIGIGAFDPKKDLVLAQYIYHKGMRLTPDRETTEKFKFGIRFAARYSGRSWVVNTDAEKYYRKFAVVGSPKSFVMLPLLAGKEVIGGISIADYDKENAFTDLPIGMLETISSNMGTAIQNARLFDETQDLLQETEQRATELQIINNIGQTLTEGLDLDNTLERVGKRLQRALGVENFGITAFDTQTGLAISHFIVRDKKRIAPEHFSLSKYKLGMRFASKMNGKPLIVNTKAEKYWNKIGSVIIGDEIPKSFAMFPLLAGKELVGSITIVDFEKENAFPDLPVGMLETIASNMGTAIQNARLFDETQNLLKQTEQRATELQIINDIGQTLTEELDLNTMIEHVGDKLREAFNLGNIRIAVVDEKTGSLISPYVYHHGKRIEFEEHWQDKSTRYKQLMRVATKTGSRSWVVNKNAEKNWRKYAIEVDEKDIPKSFVTLPLWAGKEVIGGISIPDYAKENAFTDFSIGTLETIASNMGTAIQNARLFNQTKRLFEEAEEARAAAEQANKAKSTFLANMSHELRTPLNAIIGFTRIVRRKADGALPEKQIENLEKVLSSSEHLLSLINTVLDIAKIEAGRMDVIPAKFNMSSLADQCANLATPLLKPHVKLEKQVDETIGIIFSDQDKIKQIVLNLLSNAAKFTHEGRIQLSVQKLNDENINISIADSGIGISEEALGRIFEEFQQADTSTTREYGGTGLGLAISRNLTRLLGGDLVAESEIGKGSTFTLTVPIHFGRKIAPPSDDETASIQKTTPQPKLESAKHRVLVIDDDPDALYLLQEGLDISEFDVIGARNGHAGLQIAREQQPEAILLDILMPETDGWQILNDLKSDNDTANIPVILLTIVDKKALGFKLGAADYLLKPLDPVVVLGALRRVVGEKGQARKCVLVVDDDPNVAEMLRQTLPESEFELDSAQDGEAGLRAVRTRQPDLILLDLMMPKLDGFGVIENLRADPVLRNIPIIVISAKELSSDESKNLRESVAFVMKKQGLDGSRLIQEISNAVAKN